MAKSNQNVRSPDRKAGHEKKSGGGTSNLTENERRLEEESKRLRKKATATGVLSTVKSAGASALRPSKTVLKCDGKDIVKKGQRKNKYLFAFPGLMAPVAAGKLGDLCHLDSRNPVLYIDFPQGRLKLSGTIVYPKNKYLSLNFVKGSGSIICEDCFESLVVFSESCWIGKKEDNPEELPLDMPEDLIQDKRHTDFSYSGGAGCLPGEEAKASVGGGGDGGVSGSVAGREQQQQQQGVKARFGSPSKGFSSPEKSKGKRSGRDDDSESDEQGRESDMMVLDSAMPRRQTQRAVRRISYVEDEKSDDDDEFGDKVNTIESSSDGDDPVATQRSRSSGKRKTDERDDRTVGGAGARQVPTKSPKIEHETASGGRGPNRATDKSSASAKSPNKSEQLNGRDKDSHLKGSGKALLEEDDEDDADEQLDQDEKKMEDGEEDKAMEVEDEEDGHAADEEEEEDGDDDDGDNDDGDDEDWEG